MLLVNWWGARETLVGVGVGVGGGGGGNLVQIEGPAEACTDGVGVSRGTEHRKAEGPAEASSAAAMVPFRFVGDAETATNQLHKVEGVDLAKKI